MIRLLLAVLALLLGHPAAAHLPPGSGRIAVAEPGGATREAMPVWFHRPAAWDEGGRVVVVMHGLNRDAGRYRDEWAPRAERVIIANAGSYTLAVDRPFPEGLGGTAADPATLRAVFARPVVLQLGEADTDPQHSSVPRQGWAVAQGGHRFARGWFFFDTMRGIAAGQGAAFNWRVATVPGVGHSNAGMADHAASQLFGR